MLRMISDHGQFAKKNLEMLRKFSLGSVDFTNLNLSSNLGRLENKLGTTDL